MAAAGKPKAQRERSFVKAKVCKSALN
jgi:hypothetical protein